MRDLFIYMMIIYYVDKWEMFLWQQAQSSETKRLFLCDPTHWRAFSTIFAQPIFINEGWLIETREN